MRRSSVGHLSLVVLLLMGGIRIVSAQDTGTSDYSGHPLVGTWTWVTDAQGLPDVIIFSADGGVVDVAGDGIVSLGVWEPTGDATGILTLTLYNLEAGGYRIRVSVDVAPDGQTFTSSYTVELFDPATNESMGEYGPHTGTGTRLIAESPGTPDASFEEAFGIVEEGTPAASPVS